MATLKARLHAMTMHHTAALGSLDGGARERQGGGAAERAARLRDAAAGADRVGRDARERRQREQVLVARAAGLDERARVRAAPAVAQPVTAAPATRSAGAPQGFTVLRPPLRAGL